MRRRSSIVVSSSAVFFGACAALASCSDDAASEAIAGADAAPDARKRPSTGTPDDDGGADADTPDAFVKPVNLPSCVGPAIPMNVAGVRAFVDIPVGSLPDGGYEGHGSFVVDFGSIGSTIDLHAFDGGTPTPTSCAGDAQAPGADCTFQGFDFFGDWGAVDLRTADHSTLVGVRQAGILATDFLSRNPYALDFAKQQIHRNDPASFCSDAQLLGSGFRPLPTGGFYGIDLGKQRPLSDVLADAAPSYIVPNVPTVPIAIGGTSALAQLDTGYEDRLSRRSLNINTALLALLQQEPGLVTRAAFYDIYATTCVPGLNEKLEAYFLAPGKTLDFIGEGGAVVRSEPAEAIYVKKSSDATFPCGGISTWTVPAAQVGASFFIDEQAIIVDPITSRVWIPAN